MHKDFDFEMGSPSFRNHLNTLVKDKIEHELKSSNRKLFK